MARPAPVSVATTYTRSPAWSAMTVTVPPVGVASRGVAEQVGEHLSDPVRTDMSRSQLVNNPPRVDGERIRLFGHPAK
jgi:hypothetical protein